MMSGIRPYGAFLLFAAWLVVRAFTPSRLAVSVTAIGTLLLLAAIAVALTTPRPGSERDPLLPPVVASAFILFTLVASGDLAVTQQPIDRPTSIYANGWSLQSPAVTGVIGHRLFFYLPLIGGLAIAVIAFLLGVAVSLLNVVGSQRGGVGLGLAGVLPASIVAPAACGPSLAAALGVGAAGLLGALAPPLLILSALLLAGQIWWLRRTG